MVRVFSPPIVVTRNEDLVFERLFGEPVDKVQGQGLIAIDGDVTGVDENITSRRGDLPVLAVGVAYCNDLHKERLARLVVLGLVVLVMVKQYFFAAA